MAVAGLESLVYGVADNGDPVGTLRYLAEVLQSAILIGCRCYPTRFISHY